MKAVLTVLAAVVALLAAAGPAFADVHVAKGQTVNELRVLGQDVRIDGTARGPIFVVGGNVSVGATGAAANVTVIGGQLRTAPGARLHGDVFQLGGPTPELNGWTLVATVLLVLGLHTLLVWLIVSGGTKLAASRHVLPLTGALRDRPGRTLSAGAVAAAALLALSFLLLLTVVGIPIALMIWGLLIVSIPVGVATLASLLPDLSSRKTWFWVAAIPLVGDALLALAMAVGAGVLLSLVVRAKPELDARLLSRRY